jgi:intracellular sulfur oxidation DsrE/DsrF family protein
MLKKTIAISCSWCLSVSVGTHAVAAEPVTGPVIAGRGPVFTVPENSYSLVPGHAYRVVMDIGAGPEDPASPNRRIESAARFLNMHARQGIEPAAMSLAVVLHGAAARAALDDPAHEAHFGAPNPDRALLESLGQAGVEIFLCGQTAGHYGFLPENLLPQVTLAVSAMTVHVRLQEEGYRAILF